MGKWWKMLGATMAGAAAGVGQELLATDVVTVMNHPKQAAVKAGMTAVVAGLFYVMRSPMVETAGRPVEKGRVRQTLVLGQVVLLEWAADGSKVVASIPGLDVRAIEGSDEIGVLLAAQTEIREWKRKKGLA
jgi:hypothetical protein